MERNRVVGMLDWQRKKVDNIYRDSKNNSSKPIVGL
jgi:hypothetical protein